MKAALACSQTRQYSPFAIRVDRIAIAAIEAAEVVSIEAIIQAEPDRVAIVAAMTATAVTVSTAAETRPIAMEAAAITVEGTSATPVDATGAEACATSVETAATEAAAAMEAAATAKATTTVCESGCRGYHCYCTQNREKAFHINILPEQDIGS